MDSNSAPEPTQIEVLASEAQNGGQSERDAMINAFLEAVVVVPSGSDPSKGAFQPVLIEIDGTSHMLVCDTLAAARDTSDLALYVASMRGIDVVRGVTPGHAILVRTRTTGFAIEEALLAEIRARRVQ